ncbi:hypothetical protein Hypma_014776 [Hypsizygus marmoreus]|uniref:Uncharacterized protein n=1 Tax=Hypsizygus marmoreus TaxID=39966 RepID=A0A369J9Y6_HYPMA|nr:hypothetical protein Hypma_014776 [Hypsizygus marmoreus]
MNSLLFFFISHRLAVVLRCYKRDFRGVGTPSANLARSQTISLLHVAVQLMALSLIAGFRKRQQCDTGSVTQNVLAASDFGLSFISILNDWEGSAANSRVFEYARGRISYYHQITTSWQMLVFHFVTF